MSARRADKVDLFVRRHGRWKASESDFFHAAVQTNHVCRKLLLSDPKSELDCTPEVCQTDRPLVAALAIGFCPARNVPQPDRGALSIFVQSIEAENFSARYNCGEWRNYPCEESRWQKASRVYCGHELISEDDFRILIILQL